MALRQDWAHWEYLGEGGAHVVFQSPDKNKVLRVHKSRNDNTQDAWLRAVVPSFIDSSFLVKWTICSVDSDLHQLNMQLASRQGERGKFHNVLPESTSYGFLAENLTNAPLTVEIKPKWGILHRPDEFCRFCMQNFGRDVDHTSEQHVDESAINGDNHRSTRFCPLSLFSGNKSLVYESLGRLEQRFTESRGSFKNLRFFSHGRRAGPTPNWKDKVCSALIHTHILSQLQEAQCKLDPLGIASVFHKPHKIRPWHEWLQMWTERPGADDLLYQAYVASASFKDCSIFVIFRDDTNVDVKVVDLDAKPTDRMTYWREQDQEIRKKFLQEQGPAMLGESCRSKLQQ